MGLNVLLATLGSSGDVTPFIAIGKALTARGHRATLITNPHFQTAVQKGGLELVPVSTAEDYDRITNNPDLWHPRRSLQVIAREIVAAAVAPVYEAIERLNEPGQTVIVANGLTFGARVAHETMAIPLVTVHLQPLCLRSVHHAPRLPFADVGRWFGPLGLKVSYRIGDIFIDRALARPINDFRKSLGLPPVRRLMNDWWMSPQRVIGVWPTWFAPPQPDWPHQVRLTGFVFRDTPHSGDGAARADAFFSAGEPPIVFTAGSAMRYGHEFFAAATEACRRIGRRAALVTPYAEQIPDALPDGVVHLPYVPFGQYLPRAAAIVHHGGVGTVAQAMLAGIPQVVHPMAYDQFDNGDRVERLGVGAVIPGRRFSGRRLARVLIHLLDGDAASSRCRELAHAIDPAAASRATCDAIEETASRSSRLTRRTVSV